MIQSKYSHLFRRWLLPLRKRVSITIWWPFELSNMFVNKLLLLSLWQSQMLLSGPDKPAVCWCLDMNWTLRDENGRTKLDSFCELVWKGDKYCAQVLERPEHNVSHVSTVGVRTEETLACKSSDVVAFYSHLWSKHHPLRDADRHRDQQTSIDETRLNSTAIPLVLEIDHPRYRAQRIWLQHSRRKVHVLQLLKAHRQLLYM